MVKKALVVGRDELFREKYFQGFLSLVEHDYSSIINGRFRYEPRGDALESNEALKQIIPYVWLVDKKGKRVFAYRRDNTGKYGEKRLAGKWSSGLGGHIEEDTDAGTNALEKAMNRELREEVVMNDYPDATIVGFLNDDSDSVGRVHFGVVAIAEINEDPRKGDDEMEDCCRMFPISEFESLFSTPDVIVENWTKLSWPYVKQYLLN